LSQLLSPLNGAVFFLFLLQHKHAAAAAVASAVSVLHEAKGSSLPANMLALMTELEKHGPHFASKMLITVLGETRQQQLSALE
jgi:hypothetical protein